LSYQILNAQTVLEYVRSHPNARDVIDVDTHLESRELSDGNLNFVFRVFEKANPQRSILVKQGVPYLRVAGESWPLSPARAGFEARALELQHRFAPGLVPVPYWFDEAMSVNAMEDLRHHNVMRKPMVDRTRFENLGATIGDFLSRTLFGTSDFGLEAKEKKVLQTKFANTELCEITEDLIFTEPFEPVLLGGKPNRNHFDQERAREIASRSRVEGARLEPEAPFHDGLASALARRSAHGFDHGERPGRERYFGHSRD
jgi:5-methylthioribose kinase